MSRGGVTGKIAGEALGNRSASAGIAIAPATWPSLVAAGLDRKQILIAVDHLLAAQFAARDDEREGDQRDDAADHQAKHSAVVFHDLLHTRSRVPAGARCEGQIRQKWMQKPDHSTWRIGFWSKGADNAQEKLGTAHRYCHTRSRFRRHG